jgi:hypothetical protein
MVAGGAAALRSARPRLHPAQVQSLLVNTATILRDDSEIPLSVMDQGTGRLNLERAILGTVAASPVSVSFGVGTANPDETRKVLVTNTGRFQETYSSRIEQIGSGPVPTVTPATFSLAPGASTWLLVRFTGNGLAPNEYQGYIHVEGTSANARMHLAYWYAVPSRVPAVISVMLDKASGPAGARFETPIVMRISDAQRVAITDPLPTVTVTGGGGEVLELTASEEVHPGAIILRVKLGPTPGEYSLFKIQAGAIEQTIGIRGE